MPYVVKRINFAHKATIEHEMPALQLVNNYPNIVQLNEIYDRRDIRIKGDRDRYVYYIFKFHECEPLEKLVDTARAKNHVMTKEQFVLWGLQMAKTVKFLHETHFMMHNDLMINNWSIKKNGDVILFDFGSAQIIGPEGKVPKGTKVFYRKANVAPEMQPDKKLTLRDFTFSADVWQLGMTL